MSLPAKPLAAIIAAAKRLPTTTGETSTHARRAERRALAIVCDVSGSMAQACGQQRRIDVLREALGLVVSDTHARLIAFSNLPIEVEIDRLPDPGGGTALHLAIRHCLKIGSSRMLVISDGEPDDARSALGAAAEFSGPIDVIYCGEDGGAGQAFMAHLAKRTGGRVVNTRYERGALALAGDMRRLLPPR